MIKYAPSVEPHVEEPGNMIISILMEQIFRRAHEQRQHGLCEVTTSSWCHCRDQFSNVYAGRSDARFSCPLDGLVFISTNMTNDRNEHELLYLLRVYVRTHNKQANIWVLLL